MKINRNICILLVINCNYTSGAPKHERSN